MNKLITLALTLALSFSLTVCTEDASHDKYAEWCKNLNLTPEQIEKLATYLDACQESIHQTTSCENDKALLIELTNNFESSELYQKTQQLIQEEPTLAPTIIQLASLATLEVAYALANNGSALEESTESFDALEKSIKACKACSKLSKENNN